MPGNKVEIKRETVSCDLCGGADYIPLFEGQDLQHGTAGNWPVVQCRDCGLIFTNPRPTAETLAEIYPEDYAPYKRKQRKRHGAWHKLQLWALRQHGHYPPGTTGPMGRAASLPVWLYMQCKRKNFDLFSWQGEGKLLDYGCGSGGYLRRMQSFGWKVTGMDMSRQAVEICREQELAVYQGVNPQEMFPPESFDVVTMWHVLEHVPSPTRTLTQMNSILKPKGKLVLAVPNTNSLTARCFGPNWFCWELPRHFTHFTKVTLSKMLEKTQFTVEKITHEIHGKTVQRSLKYLGRAKGRKIYTRLAGSRRLSVILERFGACFFEPDIMVIHARKK